MKNKKFIIISLIFIALFIYIFIGFSQTKLEVTEYIYHNEKIPTQFNNYKIIVISDLHHKNFGENQSDLLLAIQNENPDLILLTGDIVDEDHTDMSCIKDLISGISTMAPSYYITGNHELLPDAQSQYTELKVLLSQYGVVDLDDSTAVITKGDSSIYLHGQQFRSHYVTQFLSYADESQFNILMYHCSDYFDLISDYGYDIIVSGHTHGGIIRLPFVGGVIGNLGDFFPKYDGGLFIENNCTLFSSRGLGDARIPRFYNPPEVVSIILQCQ